MASNFISSCYFHLKFLFFVFSSFSIIFQVNIFPFHFLSIKKTKLDKREIKIHLTCESLKIKQKSLLCVDVPHAILLEH